MIPSVKDIERLRIATHGEYELTDKEVKTLRSRLYAINKDQIRQYRTLRQYPYLLVWRLK